MTSKVTSTMPRDGKMHHHNHYSFDSRCLGVKLSINKVNNMAKFEPHDNAWSKF